jgi:hypothetical protein
MRSSNDVTNSHWNGEGSQPRNTTPTVQRKLGGLSAGPEVAGTTFEHYGYFRFAPSETRNLESLVSALFGECIGDLSASTIRRRVCGRQLFGNPFTSRHWRRIYHPARNPHTNRHNRLESPPTLIKYPLDRGRRICNCSCTEQCQRRLPRPLNSAITPFSSEGCFSVRRL